MTVEKALQTGRDIIEDGTVFVCGTAAVVSRGISMVTDWYDREGDPFLCPPTALIVVPPVGHSIEECYQAVSRCTGNFLESVKYLGQVIVFPFEIPIPVPDKFPRFLRLETLFVVDFMSVSYRQFVACIHEPHN